MRAMVMLFTGIRLQDSWRASSGASAPASPAFRRTDPDADPFTQMANDPESGGDLPDKAMATFAPLTAAAVAAAYDFSGYATIADVGGGNGALLSGILTANPHLRGMLFDQPHVVERARPLLDAAGIGDRITVTGGSFFDAVPSGADAYLLKHVIHDWNDADAHPAQRVPSRPPGNCSSSRASTRPGSTARSRAGEPPPTTSTCWSPPAGGSARGRSSRRSSRRRDSASPGWCRRWRPCA
jgi:hypothetical protein